MLMVTKFLPLPDNNGGKQRSLAIARRLAELGDLVLCAYDDGSADLPGLRELGIDVRAGPSAGDIGARGPGGRGGT
jgi:NAD(P)-dependent dehydrogenase (short-subunit alcohol dehydrogenase family)